MTGKKWRLGGIGGGFEPEAFAAPERGGKSDAGPGAADGAGACMERPLVLERQGREDHMQEDTFADIYGHPVEAAASAPGTVNLLGEHTDYNEGFVLPIAIPQQTTIELAGSSDGMNHFFSVQLGEHVTCPLEGETPEGFAAYLFGCLRLLAENGFGVTPVLARVSSQVPLEAGLSSGAALEVAMLRALRRLFRLDINNVTIARMAQQAEIRFAGVNRGIMGQMAASLADPDHMLFLDIRTLKRKLLPVPEGAELLVVDSGVPASISGSMYTERRRECEEAARLLGVASLRDVADPGKTAALPPVLGRRARHVLTENARVLEAAEGVSAVRFGELMNASHASIKDDFEFSSPHIDHLTQLLREHRSVYGARLTGAGFGAACVALVAKGSARQVAEEALQRYAREGQEGRLLVP